MALPRPLKELQDDIATRIADDDALIGLHIISQDKGDIDTQVDEVTSSPTYGVYLVIEALKLKPKTAALGAYAMDVTVALTITEQVVLNRTAANPNFLGWDYVLMALLTIFSPWGNAGQAFELNPDGGEIISDTGGEVRAQVTGTAVVGWVRA